VDLGDGPQVRALSEDQGPQTLELTPRVTDTVTVSILDWDDLIDRTALGFDQLKPPGLAEIAALDARGKPIGTADAGRDRTRAIAMPCGRGPIIGVAGQFLQTSIDTTVGALLDGEPIAATPCRTEPIALPAGEQELLISPGDTFVVDGIDLSTPQADELRTAATVPVTPAEWTAGRRAVEVPASATQRLLVVPESINPGWVARTADGVELSPVTVNGWQQGWILPPGGAGTVTMTFDSNTVYRVGLFGGLALLPLLALLALWPVRRARPPSPASRPWRPGALTAGAGALAVGAVISGLAGVLVVGAALGILYLLRDRPWLPAATVGVVSSGLILAGAVLSQYPWRSVDGYIGHAPGVQLLALIAVGTLAASTVLFSERPERQVP
jgi:arabinofuranan 3-O-arabinosyltransferase